ncbi:hypothetical protein [Roseivivax sp. CAU 1761]
MTPRQTDFLRRAGDRAILWIDPRSVARDTGTKWPVMKPRMKRSDWLPVPLRPLWHRVLKNREPALIPAASFPKGIPLAREPRYLKVADYLRHRDRPEDSAWYRELSDALARRGEARHKTIRMRSEAEIRGFFASYVEPLVASLEAGGFSPDHGGFEAGAVIDAEGRICKAGSGNHRFHICRALGQDRFPLRIFGMHEDWARRRLGTAAEDLDALIATLPAIEAAHR